MVVLAPAHGFLPMSALAALLLLVAEIGARFDHQSVCEIPAFDELNTTAELIARFFHQEMAARLAATEQGRITVARVDVWENEGSLATYREE